MYEILQVTAEYSNAVLVAIMPFVSDFATRLDLPMVKPVTVAQVQEFKCSWRSDEIGGSVHLTNGWKFTFLDGRVCRCQSPQSYYSLQDPDKVPEFYGRILVNENQAVQAARQAIKKLGYSEKTLFADKSPVVVSPPHVGTNSIPRYRVKWMEPGNKESNLPLVDFEIDARNKQIQMFALFSTNTFRPQPTVGVKAPVAQSPPQIRSASRGRKMIPVGGSYSNAFLMAILPQFSEYITRGGFSFPLPVKANQIDFSESTLGIVEDDPYAFINLKNGARFVYSHGQVIAYYATNAMQLPGRPDSWEACARFVGPINMSSNDAVALVRQTLKKLGYSEKMLRVDEPPTYVGEPAKWGNGYIARYFPNWKESWDGPFRVCAEVDATTKVVTSLYVNDHVITNIWRQPPKINVPLTMETNQPPTRANQPAPTLPPPTPLK